MCFCIRGHVSRDCNSSVKTQIEIERPLESYVYTQLALMLMSLFALVLALSPESPDAVIKAGHKATRRTRSGSKVRSSFRQHGRYLKKWSGTSEV